MIGINFLLLVSLWLYFASFLAFADSLVKELREEYKISSEIRKISAIFFVIAMITSSIALIIYHTLII